MTYQNIALSRALYLENNLFLWLQETLFKFDKDKDRSRAAAATALKAGLLYACDKYVTILIAA